MSLVKQIGDYWYKQEFCNGKQQLTRWDPMSEVKSYNRAFNRIPAKDRSKALSNQGLELWRNRCGFVTMISR